MGVNLELSREAVTPDGQETSKSWTGTRALGFTQKRRNPKVVNIKVLVVRQVCHHDRQGISLMFQTRFP